MLKKLLESVNLIVSQILLKLFASIRLLHTGNQTNCSHLLPSIGQSFYAIFGSNPPQIAIVMKHAFFNVQFSGE